MFSSLSRMRSVLSRRVSKASPFRVVLSLSQSGLWELRSPSSSAFGVVFSKSLMDSVSMVRRLDGGQ